MNFFSHAVVATWTNRDPAYVLGSMLPDFAAMIGTRPPSVSHETLAAGVALHHATDDVFHLSRNFTRLTDVATDQLRGAGVARGTSMAVAHVGIEILLDGVLASDEDAVSAYRSALEAGRGDELGPTIDWKDDTYGPRFASMMSRLLGYDIRETSLDPEVVTRRLRSTLAGRPRLAFGDAEMARIQSWTTSWRARVEAVAEAVMDEVRAGLDA